MIYLIYHIESGVLTRRVDVASPEMKDQFITPGHAAIGGDSSKTLEGWYVEDGNLCQSASYPTPLDIRTVVGEKVTITGLPSNSYLIVEDASPVKIINGKVLLPPYGVGGYQAWIAGEHHSRPFRITWMEKSRLKEKALAEVDAQAETERAKLNTPGSGQLMTYTLKAQAARQYLIDPESLTDAQKLWIPDLMTAQTIATKADETELALARIDSKRLEAKNAIRAAVTGNCVSAVLAGLSWG